ncbi:MAG: hypothetical protein ABI557_03380 [Aureliella sp.]
MRKCYFAAILLTLFVSTYAVADDYLLRVETVGLRDLPNGDQEPDSKTLESVEIVVRNNNSFYGSTTIGIHKISISGMIQELKDGRLLVEMHYRRISETGESIPGVDGQRHPIRKGLNFNYTAKFVELGKPDKTDALVSLSSSVRTTLLIDHFEASGNQKSGKADRPPAPTATE